jgi:hypothetical protein
MKFKTLTGRLKDINISSYRIDWEGDFPSDFAADVADYLYPYWRHDVVVAELPVAGTKLRYDMVNLTRRIVIETDGIQHDAYTPHWHGSKVGYLNQIKRDVLKDKIAEANGLVMVRIKPDDLPLTKSFFKDHYNIDL